MDKVVDHLLVFNGNADLKLFPGNYTQYREWKSDEDKNIQQAEKLEKEVQQKKLEKTKSNIKTKLSYKERIEFEKLEKEIEGLEVEKEELSVKLSSGKLSPDELIEKSNRIGELINLIDEKTLRWLELSEFE